MKKTRIRRYAALFICVCICICMALPAGIHAEKPSERRYEQSYVLMEATTKTVLMERGGDIRVNMGSFNKLMTVLLCAEAMERGEFSLDTELTASANANSKQGAQIWLMAGEKMTVSDLLKGIIIGNANDAACVIAEKISGTEENFTALMNARAAELGMTGTLFTECTGYYNDGEQYTTAGDAALLLCELSRHEALRGMFTSRLDELKNGAVQLVTTNTMAHRYKGSVGFKCGTGPSSGCFAAEGACRDGKTFIAAVMDCHDEDTALALARELLDTAFARYTVTDLAVPEDMAGSIKVKQGRAENAAIAAEPPGSAVVGIGRESSIEARVILPSYVYAPINKGDTVGELRFYTGDRLIKTCLLKAAEDVPKKDFKGILWDMIKFALEI